MSTDPRGKFYMSTQEERRNPPTRGSAEAAAVGTPLALYSDGMLR
jgi:hypothetical protein